MEPIYDRMLTFWFGVNDSSQLHSADYAHRPQFWFRTDALNDQLARNEWSLALRAAESCYSASSPPSTTTTTGELLAATLLLGPVSHQIYRGTARMFSNDRTAVALALELLDSSQTSRAEAFAALSHIEQFFVHLTLINQSEDVALGARALDAIQALSSLASLSPTNRQHLRKYYETARNTHAVLARFGRYPQRNQLLARPSTDAELKFLARFKHGLAKSIMTMPPSQRKTTTAAKEAAKRHQFTNEDNNPNTHDIVRPQRLLYLHGFRQSANKSRKRLRPLLAALAKRCNAHVTFLDGTFAYSAASPNSSNSSNGIESQRVWYTAVDADSAAASDTNPTYKGLEDSLRHVAEHVRAQPLPYDGVIGFSQGGVLATHLLLRHPAMFRYFVAISSYRARDTRYAREFDRAVAEQAAAAAEAVGESTLKGQLNACPSLHIYGERDQMVDAQRSVELARAFANSTSVSHRHGHYAPEAWPLDAIVAFVAAHTLPRWPKQFDDSPATVVSFDDKLRQLLAQLVHFRVDELDVRPLLGSEWARNIFASNRAYQSLCRVASTTTLNADELSSLEEQFGRDDKEQLLDDDKLLLVYVALMSLRDSSSASKGEMCETSDADAEQRRLNALCRLWLTLCRTTPLSAGDRFVRSIDQMFVNAQLWRELILLCDQCYQLHSHSSGGGGDKQIAEAALATYNYLIRLFAQRLVADLRLLDAKRRDSHYVAELVKLNCGGDDDATLPLTSESISQLARAMPRIKNAIDKRSRIGRECARLFNAYDDNKTATTKEEEEEQVKQQEPVAADSYNSAATPAALNWPKVDSYNKYRKVLSVLSFQLAETMDTSGNMTAATSFAAEQQAKWSPRIHLGMAKRDKQTLKSLLAAGLSDSIVNPVPEQMDETPLEQMQPLYDWLAKNERVADLVEKNYGGGGDSGNGLLRFQHGTVTADGRLDLCKQVIGPQGMQPLLDALRANRHVTRLLLGNNMVGDEAAHAIARFIRSGQSPLTVWYIAGNHLTAAGLAPIADALRHDSQVEALWLKRNPLKASGMLPLADMLRHNTHLHTLDLLNCGLLDEGVRILCTGLGAATSALKHLYLSANGIGPVGCGYISECLLSSGQQWPLETLFLGCNRLGDAGAAQLAVGLSSATRLQRLNVASSRIGADGMRALAERLAEHASLRLLDLGYSRSTMDMGELGNFIEDEGAYWLAQLIERSSTLVSVTLNNNHVTSVGLRRIADALERSSTVAYLNYHQYGAAMDDELVNRIKTALSRNQMWLASNVPQLDVEEIVVPTHVKQMYSVYRTSAAAMS